MNSRVVRSGHRLWTGVGAGVLVMAGAGLVPVAVADTPQAEREWVVDYSGRPPFRRSLEPVDTSAAAAAPRVEIAAAEPRRLGPAGKRPLSTYRVSVETVEFARFEEGEGSGGIQPRAPRGAPGKSLPGR